MKKLIILALVFLSFAGTAHAGFFDNFLNYFQPSQPTDFILGESGTVTGLDQWSATTSPSAAITQKTYGKTIKITGLSTGSCLTLDANNFLTTTTCGSGGGGTFPFTPTTNYNALTNATNTPVWFQAGFQASSTAHLVYASSTALTVSGSLYGAGLSTCSAGTAYPNWTNGTFSCQNIVFPSSSPDGSGFAGMMTAWSDSTTLISTSTGMFGSIHATSTTATSTFMSMVGIGTTTPLYGQFISARQNVAFEKIRIGFSNSDIQASSTAETGTRIFPYSGDGGITYYDTYYDAFYRTGIGPYLGGITYQLTNEFPYNTSNFYSSVGMVNPQTAGNSATTSEFYLELNNPGRSITAYRPFELDTDLFNEKAKITTTGILTLTVGSTTANSFNSGNNLIYLDAAADQGQTNLRKFGFGNLTNTSASKLSVVSSLTESEQFGIQYASTTLGGSVTRLWSVDGKGGMYLAPLVPADTVNKLYNSGGTLNWASTVSAPTFQATTYAANLDTAYKYVPHDGSGNSDIYTNNVSRIRILFAGNVGLGTTTPWTKFSVVGPGSFDDFVQASYFKATSTLIASTFPAIKGDYVYLGTTTPSLAALTIASSTKPQITLTNGSATSDQWNFRVLSDGSLTAATSSATTFATTTFSALTLKNTGGAGLFIDGTHASSTPFSTLEITGEAGKFNNLMFVGSSTQALAAFVIDNSKQIFAPSIITAAGTPSSACFVAGTNQLTVNAALTCTVSSIDQKNPEGSLGESLGKLLKIEPVQFAYKDQPSRSRWGFYAEDLAAIDTKLADGYDKNNKPQSIDQNAILAVVVKSIQEVYHKIMNHESRLEKLERENADLRTRIEKLER